MQNAPNKKERGYLSAATTDHVSQPGLVQGHVLEEASGQYQQPLDATEPVYVNLNDDKVPGDKNVVFEQRNTYLSSSWYWSKDCRSYNSFTIVVNDCGERITQTMVDD